jgi:glyoxylase I family protein
MTTEPIRYHGIHHVSVLVSDTRRALAFYVDVLGLRVNLNRPPMSYAGAWLDAGEHQIHLIELPSPDPTAGRPGHGGHGRHCALTLAELGPLQRALEGAGVPYTSSKSGRKALFCRDPDGNAWELIEGRVAAE